MKSSRINKGFNAVAVYYLQKIAGLSQVTLNHIYMLLRVPGAGL